MADTSEIECPKCARKHVQPVGTDASRSEWRGLIECECGHYFGRRIDKHRVSKKAHAVSVGQSTRTAAQEWVVAPITAAAR